MIGFQISNKELVVHEINPENTKMKQYEGNVTSESKERSGKGFG